MYELRQQYPKGNPLNLIAKLFMNSLYGKFGIKTERTIVDTYHKQSNEDNIRLQDILEFAGETIKDFIELENHVLVVRLNLIDAIDSETIDSYHGPDANVAVSAMIVAGVE